MKTPSSAESRRHHGCPWGLRSLSAVAFLPQCGGFAVERWRQWCEARFQKTGRAWIERLGLCLRCGGTETVLVRGRLFQVSQPVCGRVLPMVESLAMHEILPGPKSKNLVPAGLFLCASFCVCRVMYYLSALSLPLSFGALLRTPPTPPLQRSQASPEKPVCTSLLETCVPTRCRP